MVMMMVMMMTQLTAVNTNWLSGGD